MYCSPLPRADWWRFSAQCLAIAFLLDGIPWQIISNFRSNFLKVSVLNTSWKSGSLPALMRCSLHRYTTPIRCLRHGIERPPSRTLAYKYAVGVVLGRCSVAFMNRLINRSINVNFPTVMLVDWLQCIIRGIRKRFKMNSSCQGLSGARLIRSSIFSRLAAEGAVMPY